MMLPIRRLGAFLGLIISLLGSINNAAAKDLNPKLLTMCDSSSSNNNKPIRDTNALKWLVWATGENSLLLKTSPQHMAACWVLLRDKQSRGRSKHKFLQRYALATLHFATTRSNTTSWDWKMAVDEPHAIAKQGYWMTQLHECQWYGITCSFRKYVIGMEMGFLALDGLLPRELSLLTKIQEIDVHGCDLQGVLPHKMLASLPNLEYLRLHMNGFFGAIHREIQGLKSLKELVIFGNYMAGTIPTVLGELRKLEVIDAYANQLSGTIPTALGKLKKLRALDLHDNNLIGSVPPEICKLKLDELVVDCLGPNPEVRCECCTKCCRGLPAPKCVDVATGKEVL